jgi:hypothetical protein
MRPNSCHGLCHFHNAKGSVKMDIYVIAIVVTLILAAGIITRD